MRKANGKTTTLLLFLDSLFQKQRQMPNARCFLWRQNIPELRKQLLDDLKEKRGYWKLKEEALDRSQWRSRFGRGYGPVARQTTERMNEQDESTQR
jgi:hypothetical protein